MDGIAPDPQESPRADERSQQVDAPRETGSSQPAETARDNEVSKPVETSKVDEGPQQAEKQKLDDATSAPGSFIEQTRTYPEAETVQKSFVSVMDSSSQPVSEKSVDSSSNQTRVEALPDLIPQISSAPIDQAGQSDAMPDASPYPSDTPPGREEEVGVLPIPLPHPSEKHPNGEIKVKDIPDSIPHPADVPAAAEEKVGVLPIPLPHPTAEVGSELTPDKPARKVEISNTPEVMIGEQTEKEEDIVGQLLKKVEASIPGMAPDNTGMGNMDESELNDFLNKLTGSHNYGGVAGQTDSGTNTGSTVAGSQTGDSSSGHSNSIGVENIPDRPTPTPEQIRDNIMDGLLGYAQKQYENGNQPKDGNIDQWTAGVIADYFEGILGKDPMIDFLRQYANSLPNTSTPGITVMRIEEFDVDAETVEETVLEDAIDEGEADDEDEDDDGDDDNGDDNDGDEDDDGDDDGDDDNGDDDGGDDDGGDSESNVSEGEGDGNDTGHKQGGPDKGGGISFGGREKDDTGQPSYEVRGLSGGTSSSGGGSDQDDTGHKNVILEGATKIEPESGGARPIDPIRTADTVKDTSSNTQETLAGELSEKDKENIVIQLTKKVEAYLPGMVSNTLGMDSLGKSGSNQVGIENQPDRSINWNEGLLNGVLNYCKDAYIRGDQPQEGNLTGWVTSKVTDYVKNTIQDQDPYLLDLLRSEDLFKTTSTIKVPGDQMESREEYEKKKKEEESSRHTQSEEEEPPIQTDD